MEQSMNVVVTESEIMKRYRIKRNSYQTNTNDIWQCFLAVFPNTNRTNVRFDTESNDSCKYLKYNIRKNFFKPISILTF